MSYFEDCEVVGVADRFEPEEAHRLVEVIVVEVLRNPEDLDKLSPLQHLQLLLLEGSIEAEPNALNKGFFTI